MKYQVALRRKVIGSTGAWHDRPYPPTEDLARAYRHLDEAKAMSPLEAVILSGENEDELQEQYRRFQTRQSIRSLDLEAIRESLEFAPMPAEYPLPRYVPSVADYGWSPQGFARLLGLARDVSAGKLGGPNDE